MKTKDTFTCFVTFQRKRVSKKQWYHLIAEGLSYSTVPNLDFVDINQLNSETDIDCTFFNKFGYFWGLK